MNRRALPALQRLAPFKSERFLTHLPVRSPAFHLLFRLAHRLGLCYTFLKEVMWEVRR
ncbi:hypothetical protein HYR99_34615 [Candidatus Poribacteria bacterium]|nr:hypothetical protein [Candidatus Poribacteria bacterium]